MIFKKLFRVNNLLKLFTLFPLVSIRQENIVVSLSELRKKVLDNNEKKNHYFMLFLFNLLVNIRLFHLLKIIIFPG